MTATRRVLQTVLLGALAISDRPAADGGSSDSLHDLHAAIERAFVRCDTEPLRSSFSRRVKTYVASGALGVADGYYGADQILLVLGHLFAERSTIRFASLEETPRRTRDGQAVLPARWRYREEGSPEAEVGIAFTLAPEGGTWYIREIRDLK
jgi:hypothetical protein